ncbi:MAG: exosortase/archaeosortase family protein [Acidobacteriaceae bacterium]
MKLNLMHEIAVAPVVPSDAESVNGSPARVSPPLPSDRNQPFTGNSIAPDEALWSIDWGPCIVLGLLLVVLYHRIAIKLVTDWATLPDFSHGFLIPFFALFLLWDKRRGLRNTPIVPTWSGIWLVALGLFALLLGVLGADLFIQRTSFVLLTAGLVWTLLGKAMLGRLKFVLFVLLLAIPLPTILFNQITFPLQLRASQFAADILPQLGVPVLQEGNIIRLPAMPLEVAEACSGIRSLMSLFTVAVIYGYFLEHSTWRRVVLALSSLPIAVAANVVRIVGTGLCVQYWDPDKALGFFHEFSGWLMFLVSLSCLYLVHVAMRVLAPDRRRTA